VIAVVTVPLEKAPFSSCHFDIVPAVIEVKPIPFGIAKPLVVRNHYLHSMPVGTELCFGVVVGDRILGVVTFGAGSYLSYRLVERALPDDCLTLSRMWLAEELPFNSESHVIGTVIRYLRRCTDVKFLVTYADPAYGHVGTIYKATNWSYTGLSQPMSRYDIGDGIERHSRSVAHTFGTHSIRWLSAHGLTIKAVPQGGKHRYIYFLDLKWRDRLAVTILPYPKKEEL
jgi:hypothetical protein